MAQTDRQTDKATHWKTAVFDSGRTHDGHEFSGQWQRLDTIPSFVKTVYRQKEICPETKREHFQIHVVCVRQTRGSQMSEWIKHTKWFPVIGKDHIQNSIKYTSKSDTAVEGTHEVIQGEKYYQLHELFQEIAKHYSTADALIQDSRKWIEARSFEDITFTMVQQDPKWVNKLSNPSLPKLWKMWGEVFLRQVSEYCEETSGAYIIEGPAHEEATEVDDECLIE